MKVSEILPHKKKQKYFLFFIIFKKIFYTIKIFKYFIYKYLKTLKIFL